MRSCSLLVLVGACNFEHGLATRVADAEPDVDAPMTDSKVDAFCDPQDATLVGCYRFEGNANDASSHGLDAQTSAVTFPTGRVGSAMLFGPTSAAEVGDSTAIDVAALTIEAWINPSQLPTSGLRMGIVDVNGQYGFFLHDSGQLRCTASVTLNVAASVATNTWTHVACTYAAGTVTIYVNGLAQASLAGGGTLPTGTSGMSIAADNPAGSGSRLIGLIDELRIFSRARTTDEICVDAGACQGAP